MAGVGVKLQNNAGSCRIMISLKDYGCIYIPETNFLCILDGIVL